MNSNACNISVVIPSLNEQDTIKQCLERLSPHKDHGLEIIVVDGGSHDDTVKLATPLASCVLLTKPGRALQMNAGARVATGQCIIFLHADTVLPEHVNDLFLKVDNIENRWGRFDVRLSGQNGLFRIIEKCMNMRSTLTGIVTGDQALFVGKELFNKVGGYPEIALMEDIAISRLLKKQAKPVRFKDRVLSSSRRWEKNGIIMTILKMWMLRLLYFFHYDTNKLAKLYD